MPGSDDTIIKIGADVASVLDAVKSLETAFDKAFESMADALSSVNRPLTQFQTLAEDLSGSGLFTAAAGYVTTIEELGGAMKLTADEQAHVNDVLTEAIAKYEALGQDVPPELQAVKDELDAIAAAAQATAETTTTLGDSAEAAASTMNAAFADVMKTFDDLGPQFQALADKIADQDFDITLGLDTSGLEQQVDAAIKQLEDLGGATALTAQQQEALAEAVDEITAAYVALGAEAPAALTDLSTELAEITTATEAMGTAVEEVSAQAAAGEQVSKSFWETWITGADQGTAAAVAWGEQMSKAFDSIKGGLGDLLTSFPRTVEQAADLGDELLTTSRRIDVSVEALSELRFIGEQTGASMEGLGRTIFEMGNKIAESDTKFTTAVESIGLSFETLKAQKPEDAFFAIIEQIQKTVPAAEQSAKAIEIFGGKFRRSTMLLREDIGAMREDFQKLDLTITQEFAEAGDNYNDNIARITATQEKWKNSLAMSVLPAINDVLETMPELGGAMLTFGGILKDTATSFIPLLGNIALLKSAGMLNWVTSLTLAFPTLTKMTWLQTAATEALAIAMIPVAPIVTGITLAIAGVTAALLVGYQAWMLWSEHAERAASAARQAGVDASNLAGLNAKMGTSFKTLAEAVAAYQKVIDGTPLPKLVSETDQLRAALKKTKDEYKALTPVVRATIEELLKAGATLEQIHKATNVSAGALALFQTELAKTKAAADASPLKKLQDELKTYTKSVDDATKAGQTHTAMLDMFGKTAIDIVAKAELIPGALAKIPPKIRAIADEMQLLNLVAVVTEAEKTARDQQIKMAQEVAQMYQTSLQKLGANYENLLEVGRKTWEQLDASAGASVETQIKNIDKLEKAAIKALGPTPEQYKKRYDAIAAAQESALALDIENIRAAEKLKLAELEKTQAQYGQSYDAVVQLAKKSYDDQVVAAIANTEQLKLAIGPIPDAWRAAWETAEAAQKEVHARMRAEAQGVITDFATAAAERGFKTIEQLENAAKAEADLYAQMLKSGKYTADQLAQQFKRMSDAAADAAGLAGETTVAQMDATAKALMDHYEAMLAAGTFTAEQLEAAWQRAAEAAQTALGRSGVQTQEMLDRTRDAAKKTYDAIKRSGTASAKAVSEAWERYWAAEQAAQGQSLQRWQTMLGTLSASFEQLANIAGGTFGGIVKWLGQTTKAMEMAGSAGKGMKEGFKQMMAGGKDWAEGLTKGIGAAIEGIAALDAATAEGGAKGIFGGAAAGAQLGAQFGGAWGAAAGAAIGAVIGMFRKPEYKKIMRDVGKDWGLELSEELSKTIANTMKTKFKDRKDNRMLAEIFHVGEMAEELGLEGQNFNKMLDLFSQVFVEYERGALSLKETREMLDKNFGVFANHLLKTGEVASEQFVQMLKLNKQMGIDSEEIAKFVESQTARAAAGIAKIIAPISKAAEAMQDERDAYQEAVNDIVEETGYLGDFQVKAGKKGEEASKKQLAAQKEARRKWVAELEKSFGKEAAMRVADLYDEQKYLEALQKKRTEMARKKGKSGEVAELDKEIAEVAARLKEMQKAAGEAMPQVDRAGRLLAATFNAARENGAGLLEAIDAISPGLDQLIKTYKDLGLSIEGSAVAELAAFRNRVTANRELVEAADAVNETMLAMSNIGALNAQTFADLQAQGTETYDQLLAKGFKQGEALSMQKEFLESVIKAHKERGFAIDAETQKMIDQAREQGILQDEQMSTNDILLEGLGAVIKAVGGDLPASFEKAAQAAKQAGTEMGTALTPVTTAAGDASTAVAGVGTAASDAAAQVQTAADGASTAMSGVGSASDDAAKTMGGAIGTAITKWHDAKDAASSGANSLFLQMHKWGPEVVAEVTKAMAGIRAQMDPAEAKALAEGYSDAVASGFKGTLDEFQAQQMIYYQFLEEGDKRLKTYFTDSTLKMFDQIGTGAKESGNKVKEHFESVIKPAVEDTYINVEDGVVRMRGTINKELAAVDWQALIDGSKTVKEAMGQIPAGISQEEWERRLTDLLDFAKRTGMDIHKAFDPTIVDPSFNVDPDRMGDKLDQLIPLVNDTVDEIGGCFGRIPGDWIEHAGDPLVENAEGTFTVMTDTAAEATTTITKDWVGKIQTATDDTEKIMGHIQLHDFVVASTKAAEQARKALLKTGTAADGIEKKLDGIDWEGWQDDAIHAARAVEKAVTSVAHGSSPTGIKEIPLMLDKSNVAASEFSDHFVTQMGHAEAAATDVMAGVDFEAFVADATAAGTAVKDHLAESSEAMTKDWRAKLKTMGLDTQKIMGTDVTVEALTGAVIDAVEKTKAEIEALLQEIPEEFREKVRVEAEASGTPLKFMKLLTGVDKAVKGVKEEINSLLQEIPEEFREKVAAEANVSGVPLKFMKLLTGVDKAVKDVKAQIEDLLLQVPEEIREKVRAEAEQSGAPLKFLKMYVGVSEAAEKATADAAKGATAIVDESATAITELTATATTTATEMTDMLARQFEDAAHSGHAAVDDLGEHWATTTETLVSDSEAALAAMDYSAFLTEAERAGQSAKDALLETGNAATEIEHELDAIDWEGWTHDAVKAANKVEEAVTAVSYGSSPTGIKEIPLMLAKSQRAAVAFARDFSQQMAMAEKAAALTGGHLTSGHLASMGQAQAQAQTGRETHIHFSPVIAPKVTPMVIGDEEQARRHITRVTLDTIRDGGPVMTTFRNLVTSAAKRGR